MAAVNGGRVAVPFFDLKGQYASIKNDVDAAVKRVFDSQIFILGPEVEAFEKEIASYLGVKHAIAVSSGTDALLVALMAAGVGRGDEVILPPFTFFATAGSIARLGAKPVFADIDPLTFNVDPVAIAARITARTKAIMPVHLFGHAVDMDAIQALAKPQGIAVIEDAAQAIGTKHQGRFVGSIGDFGCFSFFPTKNLGAAGEGGLVTTNSADSAEKVRMLRAHGARTEYHHELLGGNFRIHALQAAVLRVKLPQLDAWNDKRARNAAVYAELLGGIKQVTLPVVQSYSNHTFHQFVIRAERRDDLATYLKEQGIGSKVYYPKALHEQRCFDGIIDANTPMPQSEKACREVLALPIYPELSEVQLTAVATAIRTFYL